MQAGARRRWFRQLPTASACETKMVGVVRASDQEPERARSPLSGLRSVVGPCKPAGATLEGPKNDPVLGLRTDDDGSLALTPWARFLFHLSPPWLDRCPVNIVIA